jgi:CBS domain-containing protein
MTRDIVTVTPDTEVAEAARLLLEKHLNGVPVMEGDNLVGIICQSDLIAEQKKLPIPSFFTILDTFVPLSSPGKTEREVQKITAVRVSDAMTLDPITVDPETGIDEIASLMVSKNIHTIPVMLDDKLVGVVGKEDILRTLLPKRQ